jgi:hypothetical protein
MNKKNTERFIHKYTPPDTSHHYNVKYSHYVGFKISAMRNSRNIKLQHP